MLVAEGRLVARGRRLPPGRRPDDAGRPGDADGAHRGAPRRARPGRPGARPRRGRARPELHARRRWRPSSGVAEPDARAAAAGAGPARAARPRDRPALARARPVRVRPGAHPRGRLQHARQARPQGRATSPRRATSSRSATTSSPARSPATTSPPSGNAADGPEADALAAQARIALRGAAERAAALGSHEQAIALPRAGPRRQPRRRPTGPTSTSARWPRPMQGLVAEVAERHAREAFEARRELGDRGRRSRWRPPSMPRRSGSSVRTATACSRSCMPAVGGVRGPRADAGRRRADDPDHLRLPLARRPPSGARVAGAAAARCRAPRPAGRIGLRDPAARRDAVSTRSAPRGDDPDQGRTRAGGRHGLWEVDRLTRTNLTFRDQFQEPAVGLAMAREGLDIAGRRGSMSYALHDGRQRGHDRPARR